MTIKEYLGIEDNQFTLSNEFLFINHNDGQELILNLKTKKRFNNPDIETTELSLANIFNIPISNNHVNILTHNEQIVYIEIYVMKETQLPFVGYYNRTQHILYYKTQIRPETDKEKELIGKWGEVITDFQVLRPKSLYNTRYKINNAETLTDDLMPTGKVTKSYLTDSGMVYAPYITASQLPADMVGNWDHQERVAFPLMRQQFATTITADSWNHTVPINTNYYGIVNLNQQIADIINDISEK